MNLSVFEYRRSISIETAPLCLYREVAFSTFDDIRSVLDQFILAGRHAGYTVYTEPFSVSWFSDGVLFRSYEVRPSRNPINL